MTAITVSVFPNLVTNTTQHCYWCNNTCINSWVVFVVRSCAIYVDSYFMLESSFWIYIAVATGLLLGWYTRVWAFLTWFCHYIIMSTIPSFVYGVDIFLHIALFYLMIMPCNKALSLDLWFGRLNALPTWGVTLSLRVLQVHLCLVYLSSGYEKVLAPDWWDGNVLWRSLVQPDFRQMDFNWLARYPWLPMLLSWFTMLIETGYCIGMWIPKLRVFWLLGIISLHIGIALFLGLWLFGTIMILLSVAAFGFDAYKDVQAYRIKK